MQHSLRSIDCISIGSCFRPEIPDFGLDSVIIYATMNLSVIIPVYNEVNNIHEIIKRVQATKLATEIVIVDDGS